MYNNMPLFEVLRRVILCVCVCARVFGICLCEYIWRWYGSCLYSVLHILHAIQGIEVLLYVYFPAPEGGAKEVKGDPGVNDHRGPPAPTADSHQKQQPEGHNEGVPAGGGQVVEGVPGQHQAEHGVPGKVVQQETQDEGMPGQEQIHIQREYILGAIYQPCA